MRLSAAKQNSMHVLRRIFPILNIKTISFDTAFRHSFFTEHLSLMALINYTAETLQLELLTYQQNMWRFNVNFDPPPN